MHHEARREIHSGRCTGAVWEYNAHEGGAIEDELLAIAHFRRVLGEAA